MMSSITATLLIWSLYWKQNALICAHTHNTHADTWFHDLTGSGCRVTVPLFLSFFLSLSFSFFLSLSFLSESPAACSVSQLTRLKWLSMTLLYPVPFADSCILQRLACRLSFQSLKTAQAANKTQVSTTTNGSVPRLNKLFTPPSLSLFFLSFVLSSRFSFFPSLGFRRNMCTCYVFPCDHRMLWNRLVKNKKEGDRAEMRGRERERERSEGAGNRGNDGLWGSKWCRRRSRGVTDTNKNYTCQHINSTESADFMIAKQKNVL